MSNAMNEIYNLLNKMRTLKEAKDEDYGLDENPKDSNDYWEGVVPYTSQDELMTNITETCKSQFGADFSKAKQPMLYYEEDGDVTLSGEIPTMNNAKFQFRYKDSSGNGCYIWLSPIHLTDENIRTLSVINGVFKNWKKDLSTAEDIKPMGYKGSQGAKSSESSIETTNENGGQISQTPMNEWWIGLKRGDDIIGETKIKKRTYYRGTYRRGDDIM